MGDAAWWPAELTAPERFATVEAGLYRSAFPSEASISFLSTLGLRTAVNLSHERLQHSVASFFLTRDVRVVHLAEVVPVDMEDGVIANDVLKEALEYALDGAAYPLLLMSSSGNHGVGAAIGCLRRLQGWTISAVLDEYRSFAAPSARYAIEQVIELFDLQLLRQPAVSPAWHTELQAVCAEERAWHAARCEELYARSQPLPAYLECFFRADRLVADETAAQSKVVDSDDD